MGRKMPEDNRLCNLQKKDSISNKFWVQKCKVQFYDRLRKTQNKCGKFLI